MSDLELQPGEAVLARWSPKFTVYLRKILFVGLITALLFSVVHIDKLIMGLREGLPPRFLLSWPAIEHPGMFLISLLVAILFYIVIFDDFSEWMRHRNDKWTLTNRRLAFSNGAETAQVGLTDLRRVRRWMWWAMRIQLADGKSVMVRFLPAQKDVRANILAAQKACTGGSDA